MRATRHRRTAGPSPLLAVLAAGGFALAAPMLGASALATPAPDTSLTPGAAPSPCVGAWSGEGRPLRFRDGMAEAERRALSAAVFLALDDPAGAADWPAGAIEDAPPCELARFQADGVTWTISGGVAPAPPRVIRGPGTSDYFFVAEAPALDDAGRWAAAMTPLVPRTKPPVYLLVGATGERRFVFAAYDSAPGTKQLADDVVNVVEGDAAPIALFDRPGAAVTVAATSRSGVQADLYRPALLDRRRTATLYGPDGRYFVPMAGDAIRLHGSGLECPARHGAFERARLIVMDTRPDHLDLACVFEAGESYITVFSQRLADPRTDRAYIAEQIAGSKASTGVSGRRTTTERLRSADAGHRWEDSSGQQQALWFHRRGDDLIEARATFTPEAEADVVSLVESLFGQPWRRGD
ncbi:hypothetical protein [Phenylobacterium sp.]|uniref:hypothetical protein n=1 Tax=Phenylobacterium sp. TaxID=1871053 RepID=UPI00301C7A7A